MLQMFRTRLLWLACCIGGREGSHLVARKALWRCGVVWFDVVWYECQSGCEICLS